MEFHFLLYMQKVVGVGGLFCAACEQDLSVVEPCIKRSRSVCLILSPWAAEPRTNAGTTRIRYTAARRAACGTNTAVFDAVTGAITASGALPERNCSDNAAFRTGTGAGSQNRRGNRVEQAGTPLSFSTPRRGRGCCVDSCGSFHNAPDRFRADLALFVARGALLTSINGTWSSAPEPAVISCSSRNSMRSLDLPPRCQQAWRFCARTDFVRSAAQTRQNVDRPTRVWSCRYSAP